MWNLGLAAVVASVAVSAVSSGGAGGTSPLTKLSADPVSPPQATAELMPPAYSSKGGRLESVLLLSGTTSSVRPPAARLSLVADGNGVGSIEEIQGTARIVRFFGGKWKVSADGNPRNIELTIDEDAALNNFPEMQEKGFMSRDLTISYILKHKKDFLMQMSGICSEFVLKLFYQNTIVEDVNLAVLYTENDDFGHPVAHKMYNLTFTRDISNKIDWDNFKSSSLPRVAKSFQMDETFSKELDAED